MKPALFKQRLDDLMESAFADPDSPIPYMIFALEVAKAKCVTIELQIQALQRQHELASKIIPANGNIPKMEPPR